MFSLIREQQPRFDLTFLLKENAYPGVRAGGEIALYKMAWYLHFKEIAKQVAEADDTLYDCQLVRYARPSDCGTDGHP